MELSQIDANSTPPEPNVSLEPTLPRLETQDTGPGVVSLNVNGCNASLPRLPPGPSVGVSNAPSMATPGPSVAVANASSMANNIPGTSASVATVTSAVPVGSVPVATVTIPLSGGTNSRLNSLVPNDNDVRVVSETEAVSLLSSELDNANKKANRLEQANQDLKQRVNQLEISLSTCK